MSLRKQGRVIIVGAGPGDPGLLTVRAREVLERADVLFYDSGISEEVLGVAPAKAERIFVGRRKGEPPVSQERLNDLLVERARRGLRVVRLERDDPFLAGRGVSEAIHCQAHRVPVEIIPGLASAFATPAYSGIPALQRGVSSSVLIISGPIAGPGQTGEKEEDEGEEVTAEAPTPPPKEKKRKSGVIIRRHKKPPMRRRSSSGVFPLARLEGDGISIDPPLPPGKGGAAEISSPPPPPGSTDAEKELYEDSALIPARVDWGKIAKAADTLIFLNPGPNLAALEVGLIRNGRSPREPAAAIRSGTTARQRVVTATLDGLAAECDRLKIHQPSVVVVGDVVSLRQHLNLFEAKPLFGLRVAVTRPQEWLQETRRDFQDAGASVHTYPLIQTNPAGGLKDLIEALKDDLSYATQLIFTSQTAVEYFFKGLKLSGSDFRIVSELCQIHGIGEMAHEDLVGRGIKADMIEGTLSAKEMARDFPATMEGERVILLGKVDTHRDLAKQLRKRGARLVDVPLYDLVASPLGVLELRKALTAGELDVVTFFSPESVEAVAEAWGEITMRRLLMEVGVASLNSATTAALHKAGVDPQIESLNPTTEGMIAMISRWRNDPSTLKG